MNDLFNDIQSNFEKSKKLQKTMFVLNCVMLVFLVFSVYFLSNLKF